jgi:hypothetical protein
MQFTTDRFTYASDVSLAKFAERTVRVACAMCAGQPVADRLNGVASSRCGLCAGVGSVAVAQIACDDCGQFHAVEALVTWHVGPLECDPKEHVYSVLCEGCHSLTQEAWRSALRDADGRAMPRHWRLA